MHDVLASPNQEQHFHIKDDKDYNIGKRGQNKEQVSTL